MTVNTSKKPRDAQIFYMDALNRDDLDYIAEPTVYEEGRYVKRRAATLRGPSGELIELLEFKLLP